ncbi:MAG: zinc-dependent alcohol dehydrogenase family protein [Myxococcota bacterium]
MRAVVYDTFGRPRDVVRCVEFDAPTPGPHQVVVALEAAAIHPSDLLSLEGRYLVRPSFPGAIPGQEGVGRVIAAGTHAVVPVGTRVLLPVGCGTWRDRILTNARRVIPIGEEGDASQLSMAHVNPATAWLLLQDTLQPHLRAGEWIIQNASNGGVGQLVCQFAQSIGVRTINVVRRDTARSTVDTAGGDVVVVDGPQLPLHVRRLTNGAQIRLGLDAVGGRASTRLAACLSIGGRLVSYGGQSGEPCQLSTSDLMFREIDLRGFWLATWFRNHTETEHRTLISDLVDRVARGHVKVPVAAKYPLTDVAEAVAHASRSGRDGKVILLGEAYAN